MLELGKLDDKAQVPYLRKIKEKPGLSDDWKTVLRMALARLGDEESFQEIVEPLNRPNRLTHQPVFDQLVYVGGKRTIAFLYKLLDSDPGLRMDGDMILPSLAYRAVVTLSHLVSDPPVQEGRMRSPTESATKEYVRIWKEWFAKHPELLK